MYGNKCFKNLREICSSNGGEECNVLLVFCFLWLQMFHPQMGKVILWKCLLVSNLTVSSASLIISDKCLHCLH